MKNSKKTMILCAALAGLVIMFTFAATARAAVPELISFQGKLTDSAGKAVTSAVPMVFKLYTANTGGAAVWQETQNVTPDEYGIYTVLLGTVTPLNVSFSTAYWLGVTVGTDSEMLPRYQLVSSVYSLYSINSGTAAYSVNSATSAWAAGADWSGIINKPAIGTGDVVLAATQTFTGQNTFVNMVTVSSDIVVAGQVKIAGGTPGAGKVLTSNAAGLASWTAPAAYGDVYLASTQTFTGLNIFSHGVFFDSIIQSTGPGNGGYVGNPRGGNAVDLQTNRGSVTQVASGYASVIGGGQWNTASGNYSITAGGRGNTASNFASTVSGGISNTASGDQATVSGGQSNTASGANAVVAGGLGNMATRDGSFAAGYYSYSTAVGAFTWADAEGTVVTNNVANRTWFKNRGGFLISTTTVASSAAFAVDSAGKVGIGTITPTSTFTVVGTFTLQDGTQGAGKVLTSAADGLASWTTPAAYGDVYLASTQTFTGQNTFSNGLFFNTVIQSTGGVVAGNARGVNAVDLQMNRSAAAQVASGQYSVIGGGRYNTSSTDNSTVAGGYQNTASGVAATVGGGYQNTASHWYATVPGGTENTASRDYATVGGGYQNTANGYASTVIGGYKSTAKGDYSFAAGYASSSTANGAFTWADSEGTVVNNAVADRTWFKNRGGFIISTAPVASAAAFAVDSAGKVGIGTITPTSTFTVVGTFKLVDGTQGAGKVLTSDANGLAAWQTAATGALAIGDSYGGGKIFWLDASGRHGLIAATADQSTSMQWKSGYTGATLNAVYAGKAKTVMISTTLGSGNAAQLCNDYSAVVNGEYYDDWYLPSTAELSLLYGQQAVVGNFSSSDYWGSTESDTTYAYVIYFGNGNILGVLKTNTVHVRCVRAGP